MIQYAGLKICPCTMNNFLYFSRKSTPSTDDKPPRHSLWLVRAPPSLDPQYSRWIMMAGVLPMIVRCNDVRLQAADHSHATLPCTSSLAALHCVSHLPNFFSIIS